MWHLQASADFNHINLFCVISIGADCLLIIVICYSYFITCPYDFFLEFDMILYINRLADSFHQ